MKSIANKDVATDVIARDVAPLTVNTDAGAYSKLGWWIVLFGVCGFLLWAVLAPLDKGVPLSGTVAKETNRKAIQHLAGGRIEKLLVKDGDLVKAGQVLVQIDDLPVKAQAEVNRAQYFSVRVNEARLLAERDGKAMVAFPATLTPFKDDPRVVSRLALQVQLFGSRQAALRAELGAADENVAGLKIQMHAMEQSRDNKKEQAALLKEQLLGMRDLAKDGYIARNRLLDLERSYVQMSGAALDDNAGVARLSRQIAEVGLRRSQRLDDYQKEVRTQLADVQREADSLASRMASLDYDVTNTELRSPVDGVVVGMGTYTAGSVVGAGVRIMDILPSNDGLVVEGQLPINLIDKIHPGLQVDLIFSAFNSNKTPHIPGIVTQVSADRALDERTGVPYYKLRAKVAPEGLKIIASKKLEIQSGMPVEMFIKTGERTMANYLLKPVFDRAKSALTEE